MLKRIFSICYFVALLIPSYGLTLPQKNLVILVNFSDKSFVINNPQEAFTNMLNQPNYAENQATGSVRDYFKACSHGKYSPSFDVVGPYKLSKSCSYYGGNDSKGNDQRPYEMIKEACTLAAEAGVNFANYDNDQNGVADNVFIYYAGHNEAEGGGSNCIWPHRSQISTRPTYGGVQVYDYACTSELKNSSGNSMCGIGTFCHEFSHVLGLCDMYDTENGKYTVGDWDIMASGNYNNYSRTPPLYTAFEQMAMGWLTPKQIDSIGNYILHPIATNEEAYLIATEKHNLSATSPAPAEFWLVENKQHVGWDSVLKAIPGTGLLISHITFNKGRWNNNSFNNYLPLGFDIVEAASRQPSSSSSSDTYPGEGNVTKFVPTLNDGTILSKLKISNICILHNDSVYFHFGEYDGHGFLILPEVIPSITTQIGDTSNIYEVDTIHIIGGKLENDTVLIKLSNRYFEISEDSTTWSKGPLYFTQLTDSSFSHKFYIRHIPARQCENRTATVIATSPSGKQSADALLSAHSVRSKRISPILANNADNITPYSFQANWQPDNDAEFYHLWVFTLLDGETSIEQPHIATTLTKEGQQLTTYPSLIGASGIDFYVTHSFLADGKSGAHLIVEGNKESRWDTVVSFYIQATFRDGWRSILIDKDSCYKQFRFTYHPITSSYGNVTLKNVKVILPYTIGYIMTGEDSPISASKNSTLISGLSPNTTYYYALSCSEEKGCTRQTSELGNTISLTTKLGTNKTDQQFTILREGDHITAYLPQLIIDPHQLLVYSTDGKLILTIDAPTNTSMIEIPVNNLIPGQLYLVKYISNSQLKRKDLWAKFIY